MNMHRILWCLLTSVFVSGCLPDPEVETGNEILTADEDNQDSETSTDDATETVEDEEDEEQELRDIEIEFAPRFAGEDFLCGTQHENAGTDNASISPAIFQMYLHDIELQDGSGAWVSLAVTDDGVWQKDGIVLLDFDTDTGACTGMTNAMNTIISGQVPEGDYQGVRFKLGVPAERNNLDFSLAEAPLNNSLMFWGWMQGYRYLRLEFEASSSTYSFIHMGATSCTGNAFAGEIMDCEYPNRFDFEFTGEDPSSTALRINVDNMVAAHEVGNGDLGLVCEAERFEPDCAEVFKTLGEGLGTQTFIEWDLP